MPLPIAIAFHSSKLQSFFQYWKYFWLSFHSDLPFCFSLLSYQIVSLAYFPSLIIPLTVLYIIFCTNLSNIAELLFYGRDGEILKGKIIGSKERNLNPNYREEVAFDGDSLSFYASEDAKNGWVGLDMGVPIQVGKIGYIVRNEGNNVCVGDTYELFYWKEDNWESLGRQVAKDLVLTSYNVSDNSLLILRNLSRGKEERIFSYRNNKQIWY